MRNIFLIFLALVVLGSCKTQKEQTERVGVAQKTANPNVPYIYKNGFLSYTIVKNIVLDANELKFNAAASAMYTQKAMYDKFGVWAREIKTDNEMHPILVWEKVKLFEDEAKLYTVWAKGAENWSEIYASVLVFDENNKDLRYNRNFYFCCLKINKKKVVMIREASWKVLESIRKLLGKRKQ